MRGNDGNAPLRMPSVACAALDNGLPLAVIVEKIKRGWIVRRNAKFVGTRIIVLHDGR
jgi:hypothetical protein